MDKRMREIRVSLITDEHGTDIFLNQVEASGEDSYIVISPEQAELVCSWIMQAATEAIRIKEDSQ